MCRSGVYRPWRWKRRASPLSVPIGTSGCARHPSPPSLIWNGASVSSSHYEGNLKRGAAGSGGPEIVLHCSPLPKPPQSPLRRSPRHPCCRWTISVICLFERASPWGFTSVDSTYGSSCAGFYTTQGGMGADILVWPGLRCRLKSHISLLGMPRTTWVLYLLLGMQPFCNPGKGFKRPPLWPCGS